MWNLGLLGASLFIPVGDYELIATSLLTGTQSSVVFDVSSLGSTYKHLQIRGGAKTDRADAGDDLSIRFNADTGTNYSNHILLGGLDSVPSAFGGGSSAFIPVINGAAGNSASTTTAGAVIDILDAFSSTKNTTVRAFSGNGVIVSFSSGAYFNTASLTSITLGSRYATNLVATSRLSLYGIRG